MRRWSLRRALERWKPKASVRTRLLAAALLWTAVGAALGAAGFFWCSGAAPPWPTLLMISAGGLGLAKGRWFIAPVARRNIRRLVQSGDDRCLGGFLSWKSWLFVVFMMALGAGLRRSALPRPVLGVLYGAIGVALLTGSLPFWRAHRGAPTAPGATQPARS